MTDAPRAGPPPENRTRRPAVTGTAHLENTSSNSAHLSTTCARAETSSPIDAKRREFFEMADAVASRGELRWFVPRYPAWCRRIGDDVWLQLMLDRDLDPSEIQLLLDAHTRAAARRDHERKIAEEERELRLLARRLKGLLVPDLNDPRPQPPEGRWSRYDVNELSQGLADRAAEIFPRLFQHGRIVGDELRMADIDGNSPRKHGSCVVKLKGEDAGCWYDHSTGKGGRPLSTLKKAIGRNGRELLDHAAELVDSVPALKTNGHGRSRRTDDDWKAREIAFIRQRCSPIAGTFGEAYLRARIGYLPDCSDLSFHPDLTVLDETPGVIAGRGYPGIVAMIRDP
jgi:hypothetical protein